MAHGIKERQILESARFHRDYSLKLTFQKCNLPESFLKDFIVIMLFIYT